MGIVNEWNQLSGKTKMFLIGGGGVVLFFLFSAIRNKNSQQQDTGAGAQTAAIDPNSWIDSQTQQMQSMQQLIGGMNDALNQYEQSNQQSTQQNLQAMQDLITQNQQATQQQISALLGNMATNPNYPSTTPPASPLKNESKYRIVKSDGSLLDTDVGTTLYNTVKSGGTIQSTPKGNGISRGMTRFVSPTGQVEDTSISSLQQNLLKQGWLIAGKG